MTTRRGGTERARIAPLQRIGVNKALPAVCPLAGPSLWSRRLRAAEGSVADIYDEVDADFRAERARAAAMRYGVLAGIVLLLVLAGVGVWQFRAWRQSRADERAATLYLRAADLASQPGEANAPAHLQAAALFAQMAPDAPAGYRTLARLRAAALRAQAGDTKAALALWDAVSADAAAPMLFRELASLLWVQHQLDRGPVPALREKLLPLLTPADPWRPLAEESEALLDIRRGDEAASRRVLAGLSSDAGAPDGVRGRAGGLLQTLAGAAPAPPAKGSRG